MRRCRRGQYRKEGLPGVLVNKGTWSISAGELGNNAKYFGKQGNMNQFWGSREQSNFYVTIFLWQFLIARLDEENWSIFMINIFAEKLAC